MIDPPWLSRAEYPFAAHFFTTAAGRMHYVDEGSGPTILFVHGTPTWSFMYRAQIRQLSDRFRCIAPDNVGFGLSEKPARGLRPDEHAANLRALIEHLGLRDITLVLEDFGGPMGLEYAIEHPANVARLVLSNTWMWPLDGDPGVARPLAVMGSPLGRLLYRRLNFSPRFIVPAAWGRHAPLSPDVHRHYTAVHATPDERESLHALARAGLGSSAWYASLWERRERLRQIPAQLVWGMRDPAFGGCLPRMRSLFDDVEVIELADVGHFVADEAAAELTAAVAAGAHSTMNGATPVSSLPMP